MHLPTLTPMLQSLLLQAHVNAAKASSLAPKQAHTATHAGPSVETLHNSLPSNLPGVLPGHMSGLNHSPMTPPPQLNPAADSAAPIPDLLNRLANEAEQLMSAVFGGRVFSLLLVLLLIWGLAWGIRYIVSRRSDSPGLRSAIGLGLNALALFASISMILRHFYASAPSLTTILAMVGAGGAVFGFGAKLRGWTLGLSMVMRGHIRPGDRISIDGTTGIVEHVGLSRLSLRGEQGDTRYLPLNTLDDQSFSVASPERAYPVEAQLPMDSAPSRERLKAIEQLALLCPYRDLRSAVSLNTDANEKKVTVRFRAWSAGAARRAEAYMQAGDQRCMTPNKLLRHDPDLL